jgi:hypothetical protein
MCIPCGESYHVLSGLRFITKSWNMEKNYIYEGTIMFPIIINKKGESK